jgi:hypothetical protein
MDGEFALPWGITLDGSGDILTLECLYLTATELYGCRVQKFRP